MDKIHQDDVELIGSLLDANRLPDGWQVFLDKLLEHFNLKHINLYILCNSTFSPRFQDYSGMKPSEQALKEYMDRFFAIDKVHHAMLEGPECKWVTGNFEPYQSMLNAMPWYHYWACIKNDVPYTTGTVLFRTPENICAIVFQRSKAQGPYTQVEEDRFTAISPYIAKAVRLRVKLAEKEKDGLRLKSILNKLKLPVATLNEFGEVIAKNSKMDELLNSLETIKIGKNKRIYLTKKSENLNLQRSISQSVAIAKNRDLDYTNNAVTIYDSKNNRTTSIGSCELIDRDEDSGDVFVGAMIYVVSPDLISSVSRAQLKSLFTLTESEAHCCHFFGRNMSLKEIAVHRDTSVNTVREQIQNCYKKTGTKNQLELINMISSLPMVQVYN